VRVHPRRRIAAEELRRRALRLDSLPLRPLTARLLIGGLAESPADPEVEASESPGLRATCELDPGWVVARTVAGRRASTLEWIAGRAWWPRAAASDPVAEVLGRLWRHSVAVGIAARWLAREAGDPDAEAVARAGQLCGLGCWAVAAVEPDWLVDWWRLREVGLRRRKEGEELGWDLGELGRRLAERWGCDPLVADAAWLHADRGGALNSAAARPDRLALVQEAYRWAEQTPWSLGHPDRAVAPASEPRLRILMAEVQARCGGPFVDPAATPHEERMTRQNARLRLELAAVGEARRRGDRLLQLLAESTTSESREEWADRVAIAWCGEPEVTAARVLWHGPEPADSPDVAHGDGPRAEPGALPAGPPPPTRVLPLGDPAGARVSVQLWGRPEAPDSAGRFPDATARGAWEAWAALLSDRARLERRLREIVATVRQRAETEEARLRRGQLEALGEFAAGAGHELNNPLAVIVGRAQLLLARSEDPEVARSLRIILNQAQRAHRILRDLMFVARPPAPRCRLCRPSELLAVIVHEFERECAARGVRLVADLDDSAPPSWADPEALRHLAEILLRNALQASSAGGKIHVRSAHRPEEVVWSFSDTGPGMLAPEAAHIFDPFFCGRQAGRGLGLGLPRASRIVDLAGGDLRWTSHPGQGTTFQVHLPLVAPPEQSGPTPSASPPPSAAGEPVPKS
jgi:signal transduction histidine kinase